MLKTRREASEAVPMGFVLVKLKRIPDQSLFSYKCPVCKEPIQLSGDETNYANNGSTGLWTPRCGHTIRVPNEF